MLFLAMKLAITDRGVKFAFLVAFTLTLVIELFVPPTLGLADNGDFQKVAAYFDLFPILSNPSQDNGKFHFFSPKYTRDVHLVLTPPVSGENWTRFVYSIPYQLQYARRTDAEFIDVLYLSGQAVLARCFKHSRNGSGRSVSRLHEFAGMEARRN